MPGEKSVRKNIKSYKGDMKKFVSSLPEEKLMELVKAISELDNGPEIRILGIKKSIATGPAPDRININTKPDAKFNFYGSKL